MGSIGSPEAEPPGSVPLGFQHLLLWPLASGHCGDQNRFQPLPVNKHGGSREPCRGSSWQVWHLPATLSPDGGHKGCSCPPLQIPDAAQGDNRNKRHNPHTWPCRIRGQVTPSTAACLTESAPEGSALQEPLGIPLSMNPDPPLLGGRRGQEDSLTAAGLNRRFKNTRRSKALHTFSPPWDLRGAEP